MRLPRKLKKGIRTLRHGRPKTKWQRRGKIVAAKFWTELGQAAAAIAIVGSLPFRTPHSFKPGGIVAPKSESNPCMNNGELVMDHESVEALMQRINDSDNGHFIDNPLMAVNIKPDFSDIGIKMKHN